MKNFLLTLIVITASLLAVGILGRSPLAAADTKTQIQAGVCGASGQTNCDSSSAGSNLQGTVTNVVNLLSVVAGIAAVIMIIVGGLRYITSAGNADSAKNARSTILYAVIGLVIVALAQLIVHFVLNNTTNGTGDTPTTTNTRTGAGVGERPN